MPKCRWTPAVSCGLLLAVALASACSRRLALSGADATGQTDSRDLPFHGDTDAVGPESRSNPGLPDQRDSSSKAIPFNSPASQVLPPGTLLTVRLESPVTSARANIGKPFLALVDEPVTVEGRKLIPAEAEVKGRVESSRVFNPRRRTGYLRLTLESIRIGDKELPLPTSSLFARGTIDTEKEGASSGASSRIIRLKKGRSLTFRLTAPVDLSKATEDKAQSGTR
jgi:hypothetical protein